MLATTLVDVKHKQPPIIKPETLTSGNLDKFGKSGSNCQTLTFQNKATKQISVQYKTTISAFTSILSMFLSSKFFESGFTKVSSFTVYNCIRQTRKWQATLLNCWNWLTVIFIPVV